MDPLSIDKKRKKSFFLLIAIFGIIASLVVAILDFLEGDKIELLIDMILMSILIMCIIFLRKSNADMVIYRIGLGLICLAFLHSVAIGSGKETILFWQFVLPLMSLFFLGKLEGLFWSLIIGIILILLFVDPFGIGIYEYNSIVSSRFLFVYFFITVIAYGLESSRHYYNEMRIEEHGKLISEKKRLEIALKEIKTLSGLLPICANCKKIRDDDGYWQDVAVYIRDHSEAVFSHSICPDCGKKLYPDYFDDESQKEK